MKRSNTAPFIIAPETTERLKPAMSSFSEGWLQDFLFKNPLALPVCDIEPAFAPLIPLGREMSTKAGPVDIIYINEQGLVTLVECKLWKNPEARREVVGQILDYAKELANWTYSDLERSVNSVSADSKSLFHRVCDESETDEQCFVDAVSRNLKKGRFLLLIAGDGIRESVEQIASFLGQHVHLNFTFALVEMNIHRLPGSDVTYIVQPFVLARTLEIERAVIRIEGDGISAQPVTVVRQGDKNSPRATTTSEQIFFENLKLDSSIKERLRHFLSKATAQGLYAEPGKNSNSLMLKSEIEDLNLGIFTTSNELYNTGIASKTFDLGCPVVGENYLKKFAALFPDAFVEQSKPNRFFWTVKKQNRKLNIEEVLVVQDQWLKLIAETLDEFTKAQE